MLRTLSRYLVEIGCIYKPIVCVSPDRLGPRTPARRSAGTKFGNLISEIHMLSIFRRLMKNEQGATAIEYTLIASLIAVAAIVAMGNVGTKVNGVLSNVANTMT